MESTFHTSPELTCETSLQRCHKDVFGIRPQRRCESGGVSSKQRAGSERVFQGERDLWQILLVGWEPTEKNWECCDITLNFLTDIRHTGMYWMERNGTFKGRYSKLQKFKRGKRSETSMNSPQGICESGCFTTDMVCVCVCVQAVGSWAYEFQVLPNPVVHGWQRWKFHPRNFGRSLGIRQPVLALVFSHVGILVVLIGGMTVLHKCCSKQYNIF